MKPHFSILSNTISRCIDNYDYIRYNMNRRPVCTYDYRRHSCHAITVLSDERHAVRPHKPHRDDVTRAAHRSTRTYPASKTRPARPSKMQFCSMTPPSGCYASHISVRSRRPAACPQRPARQSTRTCLLTSSSDRSLTDAYNWIPSVASAPEGFPFT